MIIAIDGPSGAGKSTIAKLLSKKLNYEYIDTGAMYRAIGLKIIEEKLEINDENIKNIISSTDIDYNNNNVYLDGKNVEKFIRNEQVSKMASEISKKKSVREWLVFIQRDIAGKKDIIMDGRDIATVVFPNADFKFYITASPEIRAKRRYNELRNKDIDVTLEQILKDVNDRDYNDTTRKNSPLKVVDDSIVVDTSGMNIDEVLIKLTNIIERK